MSSAIRFSSVTLACPDPAGLASFYADVTGGEVTFVHNKEWASMRCAGARLEFMGVAEYVPPRWPDASVVSAGASLADVYEVLLNIVVSSRT